MSKLGKIEEAFSCFNKAIDLDANDAIALTNKAFLLAELNKTDDAINYYNKTLKINPNYVDAYIGNEEFTLFFF